MMSKFKVGDVVELNSGGPQMTVKIIKDNGTVLCEWFDKNHILQDKYFLESNIDLFEPIMPFTI